MPLNLCSLRRINVLRSHQLLVIRDAPQLKSSHVNKLQRNIVKFRTQIICILFSYFKKQPSQQHVLWRVQQQSTHFVTSVLHY